MGYTTDFIGSLKLSGNKITERQKEYINTLSSTRRMKRDVNKLMKLYKGKYGYPDDNRKTPEEIYGNEGEYFAHDDGNSGQERDDSILGYNTPPGQISSDSTKNINEIWEEEQNRIKSGICQPGLWCQWIINEENEFEWDGGEKFYNYVEWLRYYIDHFFSKWGILLNGEIKWSGEDSSDIGKIVVNDNVVNVFAGHITYEKI